MTSQVGGDKNGFWEYSAHLGDKGTGLKPRSPSLKTLIWRGSEAPGLNTRLLRACSVFRKLLGGSPVTQSGSADLFDLANNVLVFNIFKLGDFT